jgi:uncharacterized protein (DUF2236 family)
MNSTNAVLVALAATDGPIDKMELATGVFNAAERSKLASYQSAAAAGTKYGAENGDVFLWNHLAKYLTNACRGKLSDTDAVMVALCATNGVVDKLELATGQLTASERAELAMIQAASASAGWREIEVQMFLHSFKRYIDQCGANNL